MPKVHIRVEQLQASSAGVFVLYYTACGRLLKGKQHGRTISDVTCLTCKRTAYATWLSAQDKALDLSLASCQPRPEDIDEQDPQP